MGDNGFSVSSEVIGLESLANQSENNIIEIESLISKLRNNKVLINTIGKEKVFDAIKGLYLLTSAYNKLIAFAEIKISNSLSLKKCTLIRLFNIDNIILSLYENHLFFSNSKITKRMSNLEGVIKKHRLETFEFLDSSNDRNYH